MKVFLTGATGYIGHQLALKLANEDFEVHAFVRDLNSINIPKHHKITLFKGDICDYQTILPAMTNCEYVFHTAAYTDLKCNDIDKFYKTNVVGTENVLKASMLNHIRKVIYTSTVSVFGPSLKNDSITEDHPRVTSYLNDYELTKKMSEELVLNYVNKGLDCCILNVSRVYGPGLKSFSNGVNKLIVKILNNELLIVPSRLNKEANYVFIGDVVKAHLLAVKEGETGENYIIGGENSDYLNLFRTIGKILNSKTTMIKLDYTLMKVILTLSNSIKHFFGMKIQLTTGVLESLFTNRSASSQKAISSLNYSITPLEKGLTQTIKFLSK